MFQQFYHSASKAFSNVIHFTISSVTYGVHQIKSSFIPSIIIGPSIVLCPGGVQRVPNAPQISIDNLRGLFSDSNDLAYEDPRTVHNLAVLQQIIQQSKGKPWAEQYSYVFGLVVGLAQKGIVFTTENFKDHFKTISGVPAWGRVSNNVWTRMLGGNNAEWVKLMPLYLIPRQYLVVMQQDTLTLNPWWQYWSAACKGLDFAFTNPLKSQPLYSKPKKVSKIKYSNYNNNKKRSISCVAIESNNVTAQPPKRIKLSNSIKLGDDVLKKTFNLLNNNINLLNNNNNIINSNNTMNAFGPSKSSNGNTFYNPFGTYDDSIMSNNNRYNSFATFNFADNNNVMNTYNSSKYNINNDNNKYVIDGPNNSEEKSIINKLNATINKQKILKPLKSKNKMRRKHKKEKKKKTPGQQFENILSTLNEGGLDELAKLNNNKQSVTFTVALMNHINKDINNKTNLALTIQNIKYVCNKVTKIEKNKIFMNTYNQFVRAAKSNIYVENNELPEESRLSLKINKIITNQSVKDDIEKYMKECVNDIQKESKNKKKKKKKKKNIDVVESDEDMDIDLDINDSNMSNKNENDNEKDSVTDVGTMFSGLSVKDKQIAFKNISQEDRTLILKLLQEEL